MTPTPRTTAGGVAGVALALVGAALLAAPWLPLPPPEATDLASRLLPLGALGHPLGTDALGRDLLSRLLFGMRASLVVAAFGTAVAAGIGTGVGLAAGYRGGRLDDVLMRAADVLLAFPYVLLALALVSVLGPGLRNAALAVAIVNVPFFARTVRGSALALREEAFVEVARLSGHGDLRIAFVEVLPNALPVLSVAIATTFGWMILETAGLSFLGLGAQPPEADLGSLLGEGRRFLTTAPHLALVPGLALFALSLAVHAGADGLRDRWDPRRARRSPDGADAGRPVDADGARASVGPTGAVDDRLWIEDLGLEIPGAGLVLDGVDLRVGPGEAVALVGESGSGKTLTALTALGLEAAPGARVVRGRIRLAGRAMDPADPEARRLLRARYAGFVPQDPAAGLNPVRRIGDQLVETLRLGGASLSRREARSRAAGRLAEAQLPEPDALLDAFPHQLSGGMQQRVLIALALARDPSLLVADEPTTALDVTVQRDILALLDRARRESNRSLLLVTHDFGVVSRLCDRVSVLRHGRVVESGSVAEVLGAPRHPYTRSLIESLPRLDDPERVLRVAGAPS